MRLGEISALKWENIDLKKGQINVKKAVSSIKNRDYQEGNPEQLKRQLIFQNPKSKKSLRSIPLPGNITDELKKLKAWQAGEKLALGPGYQDQGFAFTWEDGRMVDPNYLSKHFLKLARNR